MTTQSNRVRKNNSTNQMASQVRLPTPRAAKNEAAQLPEFLRDGSLIADLEGEDLWATGNNELWIVPHPYRGGGEKKITYPDALLWLEKLLPPKRIEQFLAEKGVFSSLAERREQEWAWFDSAQKRRLNHCLELERCFSGMRAIDGYSDEFVLDLVCGIILDHEDALVIMARERTESADFYWHTFYEEAITAARAVVARARWNGLKETPTSLDRCEDDKYRREPLLLDLPGVNGLCPYTDRTLLFQICTFLYRFQQEIFDSILPGLKGRKRLALAEAMVFAEKEVHRGAGEGTELDNLRRDELSKWQRVMNDARASLHHPFILRMRHEAAA